MSSEIIRNVTGDDASAIADIYNRYIEDTIITFEEESVSANDIEERIETVVAANLSWIVLEKDKDILGYAYVMPWKSRSAYRFTAESTVYLAQDRIGGGRGTLLYKNLIQNTKQAGFHSLIGIIALPNPSSIALHEKLGFQAVATLKEVGIKFGKWIDVGYWQLTL